MLRQFFVWIPIVVAQYISCDEFHKNNLHSLLSLKVFGEDNLLLPFNETRAPGTEGSLRVQDFIKVFFEEKLSAQWSVETDSFEENGHNFTNLVFTPVRGNSYVVLAAHYDSKIDPPGFVGAMDSGASCAILLYLAKFIDHVLLADMTSLNPLLLNSEVGLKIVFFDGEEAIEKWSPQDSIYGSKHLANKWRSQGLLNRIDLFVLMDLLGSTERLPVHSYYRASHYHYTILSDIESSLVRGNSKCLNPSEHKYMELGISFIDDDHRPFYDAGIPILHLIPYPFPSTWHTTEDDFDHLDEDEIHRWATMMCEFVIRVIGEV